jgi:hypothetical protein
MSLRSSIVLLASLSMLAALAGCGGSGNSTGNGTITGTTTTNSQLNGSYTFSTTGTDNGGNFFAIVGTFTANGSGGVTGGSLDYSDPGSQVLQNFAINGGSYAVGSDGRGTATLTAGSLGKIGFDFVLSSTSHGLIIRFDSGGTGSGTMDLQSSSTSLNSNSYAFLFSGIDVNGSPAAQAGAFTVDGSGNATGVQDVNDALSLAGGQSLTGTITAGSGSTPGTATLNGPFGAQTFDVFSVDQTHAKFIETDGIVFLTGDVFTQQNASLPSGAAVFTIGGLDINENPLAAGGLLTFNLDGVTVSGSEDSNDGGTLLSQISFSGSYSALSGGRSVLAVSGFNPASQFVIYPSSGGLLMLEMDATGLTSGTALAQSATSFSTSGGYGFNLSASNLSAGVEVDSIAAFTATSSSISGTIDENDGGSTHAGEALTGTVTAPSGGRGTMTLQDNNSGTSNYVYYVASSSSVLVIETDSGQVGVGSFLGQSSVGSSAALVHAAMARPKAGFHPALKKKLIGN